MSPGSECASGFVLHCAHSPPWERAMGLAQDRGRAGEALAAAYLELIGCRTVARNVRLGGV